MTMMMMMMMMNVKNVKQQGEPLQCLIHLLSPLESHIGQPLHLRFHTRLHASILWTLYILYTNSHPLLPPFFSSYHHFRDSFHLQRHHCHPSQSSSGSQQCLRLPIGQPCGSLHHTPLRRAFSPLKGHQESEKGETH